MAARVCGSGRGGLVGGEGGQAAMTANEIAALRWGRKNLRLTNQNIMKQLADPERRAEMIRAHGKRHVEQLELECSAMRRDLERY